MKNLNLTTTFAILLLIPTLTFAGGRRSAPAKKTGIKKVTKPATKSGKFNNGPTIRVNFLVTRSSQGKGNNKWLNKKYVQEILDNASKMSKFANFTLNRIIVRKDSGMYYSKSQYPSLKQACRYSSAGIISVAISGEKTTSSAGLAFQAYKLTPCFAMRSRYNAKGSEYSQKAYSNNAAIFLHELGHNMNLKHSNQVKKGAIHADDFWRRSDGIRNATSYIKRVISIRGGYSAMDHGR